MRLNPFSKKQSFTSETKSTGGKITQFPESLQQFLKLGYQGAANPGAALRFYDSSSAVSIPVNVIAELFAGLRPILKTENDGDLETVYVHPVLELLNSPSPFFDKILFFETIAKNYLVTGENEIVALGNVNFPPTELQPISPSAVSVVEGEQGLATSFDVSGNTLNGSYRLELKKNKARYFDGKFRELKQTRNFSTRGSSLLRGTSPLRAASDEVRQDILGNDHNVALLENGGRVSMVFNFKQNMSADDFDAVKGRVREQYGGAAKAGTIGVTAGENLEISEIGTNNKDMDFAELKRMARQAIALQYKFPIVLMSTDAATFSNYETAKLAVYDDAVLPLADRLFASLSEFLLPRYGLDPATTTITYDKSNINALTSRTLDEIQKRKEIGVESDNELRESMGRAPYEGGDLIYKPANLIPVGDDVVDENTLATADSDAEKIRARLRSVRNDKGDRVYSDEYIEAVIIGDE